MTQTDYAMGVAPLPGVDDRERDEILARALLRRIGAARRSPADFFDFVIREETTRARIKIRPFQRVALDFVAAHDRCVLRLPIGFSKTYLMATLTLHLLGQDPTERGAVVSSTEGQASKPLMMVRDYIETSSELRAVFPALRPSVRPGDSWTTTRLVVDRPAGIRDPSLLAVGVGGALLGSRLSWIVVDDILSPENTATLAARETVRKWFGKTVLSRKDIRGSKVVLCNTPFHPKDMTYLLEEAGWPSLSMDVWGNVTIKNADDFDTDDIRPSAKEIAERQDSSGPKGDVCRLTAHDDPYVLQTTYGTEPPPEPTRDVDEIVPLWPEKYDLATIEDLKTKTDPADFLQLFGVQARDESVAKFKIQWYNDAKERGRKAGLTGWATKAPEGAICIVTGVDLGVGKERQHAWTAIFTFAVLPSGHRVVLRIDRGKWGGREIIDCCVKHHTLFDAGLRVENNAGQDFLRQWMRDRDVSMPVRAHTTGKNKADPRHGVESMFVEWEQGAWIIPCDAMGQTPEEVRHWVQDLIDYEPPPAHTGDVLMASWFAREEARKRGAIQRGKRPQEAGSIAGLLNR